MKLRFLLIALSVWVLVFTGCDPEEITNPINEKQNLAGFWTAGGNDIAPMLADSIDQISLRFRTDSTYNMALTLASGVSFTYSGAYRVHKTAGVNDIYPFTLNQTNPSIATIKGIFEINEVIEPEELTIEYVQTQPSSGYTPPTPDYGFGSTNEGNLGTTNISRFQRVE